MVAELIDKFLGNKILIEIHLDLMEKLYLNLKNKL